MKKFLQYSIYAFVVFALNGCFHNNPAPDPVAIEPDPTADDDPAKDNTDLPKFSVTSEVHPNFNVREDAGRITFTIEMERASSGLVTFLYRAHNGGVTTAAAEQNSDFFLMTQDRDASQSSVEIAAGQTAASFSVNINPDNIDEQNEIFVVDVVHASQVNEENKFETMFVTIIDDDDLPVVELLSDTAEVRIKESSGTVPLKIRLPGSQSQNDIHIPIQYITNFSNPATADTDFIATSKIVIPAATTQQLQDSTFTFDILLHDDVLEEADEYFIIDLQNPLDNRASLVLGGLTSLTVVIEDDDIEGLLNDTQITSCADGTNHNTACGLVDFPDQDGDRVNQPFSFSGVDITGAPTAFAANIACIKDERTGLLWEVKTNTGLASNKREYNYQYTWFNHLDNANGGDPGMEGTSVTTDCSDTLEFCNTAKYIEAMNNDNVCNQTNWRLPRVEELVSILQFHPFIGAEEAMIDRNVFRNMLDRHYWTGTPVAYFPLDAWAVYMGDIPAASQTENVLPYKKTEIAYIIAVANKGDN